MIDLNLSKTHNYVRYKLTWCHDDHQRNVIYVISLSCSLYRVFEKLIFMVCMRFDYMALQKSITYQRLFPFEKVAIFIDQAEKKRMTET